MLFLRVRAAITFTFNKFQDNITLIYGTIIFFLVFRLNFICSMKILNFPFDGTKLIININLSTHNNILLYS